MYKHLKPLTTVTGQLALLSIFCILLELARLKWTGYLAYIFLAFNLLLAWIPMGIAIWAQQSKSRLGFTLLLGLWLLFFPNAPYIITDLLHLKPRMGAPFWYDVLLVYSFAFTGFLLGMVSAIYMYRKMKQYVNGAGAKVIMGGCMFLSGYGIYLGRFLRWNSWDIVVNPHEIVADTCVRLANPTIYPGAFGVTLIAGGLLCLAFMFFETVTYRGQQ